MPKIRKNGVMNVGIYRGMIAAKNKIPILMWRAQHIGHHVTAWQQAGHKEMPIAVAIGWLGAGARLRRQLRRCQACAEYGVIRRRAQRAGRARQMP